MSALRENQCYGLSGGAWCRGGNVSVVHVKLTDSAARAMDRHHNMEIYDFVGGIWQRMARDYSIPECNSNRLSHPTIRFTGEQGRMTIPCADGSDEVRVFTFSLTNVARDNPYGSFDCVKQLGDGAVDELSCVGLIQKKMTVNATDDSYHKARQSMAQAEGESRSKAAIVIKDGMRLHGKKVTVRAPAPALVSLAKPQLSSSSSSSSSSFSLPGGPRKGASRLKEEGCASDRRSVGAVENRPLRERLAHLLGLRPYKRPELILRLQKDGLRARDKDMLDAVLLEVGQLNSRDNTYILKDSLYKDLQRDWPGYTTGDQQLLRRILVRRLFKPHRKLLSVPETQVSPLRDTPNSSPARPHKHSLTEEYTDPLASKKPRISHITSKMAADNRSVSGSCERLEASRDRSDVTAPPKDGGSRNPLDPGKPQPTVTSVPKEDLGPPAPQPASPHLPSNAPLKDKTVRKRRRSKHKHRDQVEEKVTSGGPGERRGDATKEEPKNKVLSDCTDINGMLYDSSVLRAASNMTDFLSKYTAICSHDQRQSYKQDFNEEYSEYRALHSHIDSVTRQFMDLNTQLKQLHRGSHKYKTIHNQILKEYRKIKKSNPNYNQDKIRCEYLHNKLAHIKRFISEYDRQQFSIDSP